MFVDIVFEVSSLTETCQSTCLLNIKMPSLTLHCVFPEPVVGVHPFNTVADAVYDAAFVNEHSGAPLARAYNGAPLARAYNGAPSADDSVPSAAYDGAPFTTYNGAPFTTYNGALFTNYGAAGHSWSFNGAPTTGFGAPNVFGYSFGPLPVGYFPFGDFPFVGFHGNVENNFGEAAV